MSLHITDDGGKYDNEHRRVSAVPDDGRTFEVRVSVLKDFPYAPYLTLWRDEPEGTERMGVNLAADELIALGETFISVGTELIEQWTDDGCPEPDE